MDDDRGAPIAYLALEEGTDVFASDGERIGTVEHVLADERADIFDGLIVDTRTGPGGWRFADALEIESIHERAVVLKLDSAAAANLPKPDENPAVVDVDADDADGNPVTDKLRRAWDYLSGRY